MLPMTRECVLWESLGKNIRHLEISRDRKDFDESFAHVFMEVMVAHIDVLGMRTQFWETCELESARIIFENLAINVRFGAYYVEVVLPHFLNKIHDRDDVAECHRHRDVLCFGRRESNLSLQLGCPNDRTSGKRNKPTASRFRGAWIGGREGAVPVTGEVSVVVALEPLFGIGLKSNTDISCFLQVSN